MNVQQCLILRLNRDDFDVTHLPDALEIHSLKLILIPINLQTEWHTSILKRLILHIRPSIKIEFTLDYPEITIPSVESELVAPDFAVHLWSGEWEYIPQYIRKEIDLSGIHSEVAMVDWTNNTAHIRAADMVKLFFDEREFKGRKISLYRYPMESSGDMVLYLFSHKFDKIHHD